LNSQNSNGSNNTAFAHTIIESNNKEKKPKTRVLSIKIAIEDYQAYKIFADQMFYGSMSTMVKTALRHELRVNAVNDEKFEILKDAAKTGDLSKIDNAFFILKPRLVKLKRPRNCRVVFEC
jgi:hypothetical protein